MLDPNIGSVPTAVTLVGLQQAILNTFDGWSLLTHDTYGQHIPDLKMQEFHWTGNHVSMHHAWSGLRILCFPLFKRQYRVFDRVPHEASSLLAAYK